VISSKYDIENYGEWIKNQGYRQDILEWFKGEERTSNEAGL
jgi:hypothetical protein